MLQMRNENTEMRNCITLNRSSEWNRALVEGLAIDGHVLRGLENSGHIADSALMITGSIDSFEHEHIWDAIRFDWSFAPNTNCRISCFASNSKMMEFDGRRTDFDTWLTKEKDAGRLAKQSAHMFTPARAYGSDGLLGCRGRYLWLRLDIVAQDRASFELRSIKLELPGERIISYLPDIYRKGIDERDFFYRFMAVFDSIFFSIEDDINRIGEKLDYRTADEDVLAYQAGWLGINERAASSEALREQIGSIVWEYRMSGTREGLALAVERQTGFKPIIVEYFQVEKMVREGRNRQTYKELFGSNPYKIFVMLPESSLTNRTKITVLTSRIRSCIPAHVDFEIISLQMNVRLDRHTYLEINSCLSDFSSMVVEERSILHHDIYIGGQTNE